MPTHADHPHRHGPGCGHPAIRHGDHVDYVHEGHLHTERSGAVSECAVPVDAAHPDTCRPVEEHGGHRHGPGCGHVRIPHGNHQDWLVDGRLHHEHDGHCDDHGSVEVIAS